jgi:predicted nucleic acid-binding protein
VTKFVLDTNIYVTASRSPAFGAELVQFASNVLPRIYLHAVVVQELLRGAIHEQARHRLERELILPFEKRGRIIVPSYRAWKRSGEIIAELVERNVLTAGGVSQSFTNDTVLAASCREHGIALITLNESDFARIATVEPIPFHVPWPRT